jgi:hypothetical protein
MPARNRIENLLASTLRAYARDCGMSRMDVAYFMQDEQLMPFHCMLFRVRHGINTIR